MGNSFVVQYAVQLLLTSMGIPGGFLGFIVGKFSAWVLGELLDRGIIVMDITIDKLKEALKDPQWKAAAEKAYKLATAKVYTEEEKDAIRKQYLDALAKYATYGNGVSDNQNP